MFARLRTISNLAFLLAGLLAWPSAIPWPSTPAIPSVAPSAHQGRTSHGHVRKLDPSSPVAWPGEISIADGAEDSDEAPPSPAPLPDPAALPGLVPSPLLGGRPHPPLIAHLAPRSPRLRC